MKIRMKAGEWRLKILFKHKYLKEIKGIGGKDKIVREKDADSKFNVSFIR